MSTKIIPFKMQVMGYDKNQINNYIQKLSEEYDKLYAAYTDLSGRYGCLEEKQSDDSIQAISRALITAQIKAAQIIDEVRNEALQITEKAHMELGQLRQEKDILKKEIHRMVKGLKAILPVNDQLGERK